MSLSLRVLRAIGRSGLWRGINRIHAPLYRMTGGRVGHRAGKITNLLLTTTGRKTGAPRTVALAYIQDDGSLVVVASNGGSDRHPAWWLNLQQKPRGRVQVADRTFDVIAHEADDEERPRLWPRLKEANPFYGRYEKITDRKIPVVVLTPA